MYATCLFCSGALGRNESIEHFPVGRRLAFDAAKGRLWVICTRCNRWNLTPLESRWEAIEEAERAYCATKLRSATDNIGMAKLKEGTELVRIGRPMLPEFAAWRYGEVFRVRHWKAKALAWGAMLPYTGYQLLGISSLVGLGSIRDRLPAPLGMSLFAIGLGTSMYSAAASFKRRRILHIPDERVVVVRTAHAKKSLIIANPTDGTWSLRLRHARRRGGGRIWNSVAHGSLAGVDPGYIDLHGDAAARALSSILPVVNQAGSSTGVVARSLEMVTGPTPLAQLLAGGKIPGRSSPWIAKGGNTLEWVSPDLRLALEMSLHEADERRALEGELAVLETRWREAEEVAAIADRMFLPNDLDEKLDHLRKAR